MKTCWPYGIIANSKTRVRCVFCGVFIPKAAKCIEQHTNGIKHSESLESIAQNGIRYIEGLFCKLCNSYIDDEESAIKHILENEEHSTCSAALEEIVDGEFVNVNAFLGSDENDAYCELCNQKFNCTLEDIEQHVNLLDHKAKFITRLKSLNGIFYVNDDEVWCKICDDFVENSTEGILEHIDEGRQHIEWFMELEDLIEGHEFSVEPYLTNELETNAYCQECHRTVLCNFNAIHNHIYSYDHLFHIVVD